MFFVGFFCVCLGFFWFVFLFSWGGVCVWDCCWFVGRFGFFPARSSDGDTVTALSRALWADPAAALPGPLGKLLPWRRHGTPPAGPTFPDLPQIRDLRIGFADLGASGRCRPCPALSGRRRRREPGRAPSGHCPAGDTWGSGPFVCPPTSPQHLRGHTAGAESGPSPTPAKPAAFRSFSPQPRALELPAVRPGKRWPWSGGRARPFPSDSRKEK